MTACAPRPKADPAKSQSVEFGYLQAPRVTSARAGNGVVVLFGQSAGGARIRLSSPAGQALGTTASDTGSWSIEVPSVSGLAEPMQIFGLSQEMEGRLVQGEGYIAVLSSGVVPAVLLRAGSGAQVLPSAKVSTAPLLAADFDEGGALAVSGRTLPDQAVRASLDGVLAAESRSDRAGLYRLNLSSAARRGLHKIDLNIAGQLYGLELDTHAAQLGRGILFKSTPLSQAWRIDWTTPSGGVQSTVVAVLTPQG